MKQTQVKNNYEFFVNKSNDLESDMTNEQNEVEFGEKFIGKMFKNKSSGINNDLKICVNSGKGKKTNSGNQIKFQ